MFLPQYQVDVEAIRKKQDQRKRWLNSRIPSLIFDIYRLRHRFHDGLYSKGDFEIYKGVELSKLADQINCDIEDDVSRNQLLWMELKLYDEESQKREQINIYLEQKILELDQKKELLFVEGKEKSTKGQY